MVFIATAATFLFCFICALSAENNARFAARLAVLRQCHTGHSNAWRDDIEGLTKSAAVLKFHDG